MSLDAQGLVCPEPLMLVRNQIRQMQASQVLHVLATDPTTHRDFKNFCHFMGHTLMHAEVDSQILQYWIRKGEAA